MALALEMATGSYAVTFAPSFMSWLMIGMDLASRMSLVFGLKDKPRMAIRLSCRLARYFLARVIACLGWWWFTSSTALSRGGL